MAGTGGRIAVALYPAGGKVLYNISLADSRQTFDISRGCSEHRKFTLNTSTHDVQFDAEKTALVIIDMQNFFLHDKLRQHSKGLAACDVLTESLIPACRKAGMRVVYINWGLDDDTYKNLPPATVRSFARGSMEATGSASTTRATDGKSMMYAGIGRDMGTIEVDGNSIPIGRMLYKSSWNAELYGKLLDDYNAHKEDGTALLFHKERISGLAACTTKSLSPSSAPEQLEDSLQKLGIRTLLFTGVNTDQCVFGTCFDAYNRGFDCILVEDACATTAPEHNVQSIKWLVEHICGFVTDNTSLVSALGKAHSD